VLGRVDGDGVGTEVGGVLGGCVKVALGIDDGDSVGTELGNCVCVVLGAAEGDSVGT